MPYAAGSVAAYIVLGGFGVPVFAGFSGGPAVLFGPTGGYIFGYLFTAVLTALGARGGMHPVRTGIWMAAGLAVCYALGTAWFMAVMPYTLAQSLAACVTPFVVPDIVKGVAAYSFCKVLSARMAKARTVTSEETDAAGGMFPPAALVFCVIPPQNQRIPESPFPERAAP